MEPVIVRTYQEGDSPIKQFGAHYERANGERTMITTRERGCQFAQDKATKAAYECEWDQLRPDRQDGFIDVGHGWVDIPEASL